MFSISARLDAQLSPDDILAAYGLERGGRVQRTIDQKVIDYCQPYVPASPDRTLEFSAQASTEIGSGQVVWNTPYAHYQYMGIVYGPNIPIIEDGILMGFFSQADHLINQSAVRDSGIFPQIEGQASRNGIDLCDKEVAAVPVKHIINAYAALAIHHAENLFTHLLNPVPKLVLNRGG